MTTARSILVLCRISNLPTVFANVLAAWFLGGGSWDNRLALAALGAALCYSGGMILNDVFDADWDRQHRKPRPIPEGWISRTTAAWLGWVALGTGVGIFLALRSNPLWAAGLAAGIIFYNHLHKTWSGSIWLMGACRFFLFITVASIPAVSLPLRVWLWGMALAGYVAGITLAARNENTGGKMHPEALAWLLLPAGCACYFLPEPGHELTWPLLVAVLFCLWVLWAHRRLHSGRIALGSFVAQLIAGMVFVDAMGLSTVFPHGSLLCLSLLPLNLFLQVFVPAT